MAGSPKRWIAGVFAGISFIPFVMVGLGLATALQPQSEISDRCVPLVPMRTLAPSPPAPALVAPGLVAPMPAPPANALVYVPRHDPMIAVNLALPQSAQRLCPPLAALPPDNPASPEASFPINPIPFQEAHWQGVEVIPLTDGLKRILKITSEVQGVLIDDVTMPADVEGFWAGDLITSVGQVPTPTLESFIKAADRVRDRRRTEVQILRKNKPYSLVLTALQERLGTANGETAPMIKAGSRPPHGYMGACTHCHRIGTTGQLALDQGDLLTRKAPSIRATQTPPHRDRGACTACHTILP